MAENWIEKAAEEITKDRMLGAGADKWIAGIITKCAPVIDAPALAEKIQGHLFDEGETISKPEYLKLIGLITSNLDLSITWVDGEARWGDFLLLIINAIDGRKLVYDYRLYLKNEEVQRGRETKPELAQAACVDALKRIVCGVKG